MRACCARCCCSISNRIRLAAAIDIVTIELDPAPGRVIQYSLLERALPSAETLATLTARLGALVGETRCGSPVLLDTHRPDGFEMRAFRVLDRRDFGPRTRDRARGLGTRAGRLTPGLLESVDRGRFRRCCGGSGRPSRCA